VTRNLEADRERQIERRSPGPGSFEPVTKLFGWMQTKSPIVSALQVTAAISRASPDSETEARQASRPGHGGVCRPYRAFRVRLERSQAELLRRNCCAGIGVVARYEHGLPLPLQGRIRSKLRRRQMIEGFYEACSTPSTSAKERRVVQGRQRGRLYPVSLIDPRRSIHPGSEWFSEDRTQADLADGPSASGLLRLAVADSGSETELSASYLM